MANGDRRCRQDSKGKVDDNASPPSHSSSIHPSRPRFGYAGPQGIASLSSGIHLEIKFLFFFSTYHYSLNESFVFVS